MYNNQQTQFIGLQTFPCWLVYDDVSRMIYEMASICYDLLLNIELITQNLIDNGMKNALKNM